jgi:hypothetical protein
MSQRGRAREAAALSSAGAQPGAQPHLSRLALRRGTGLAAHRAITLPQESHQAGSGFSSGYGQARTRRPVAASPRAKTKQEFWQNASSQGEENHASHAP